MICSFHIKTVFSVPLFLLSVSFIKAADDPKGIEYFEKKIRPVLVESCYECHSAQTKKTEGNLALDSKDGLRKGGDSGPSIEPGKPQESLLIKALRQTGKLKMPPAPKKALPPEVIADFTRWIEMGAPDPREGSALPGKRVIDIEKGKQYWAFRQLLSGAPPRAANEALVKTAVDRFILARLEDKKLSLNSPAGNEKLIRRVYYDLLGLPPTPQEVDAFIKDASADAYEKMIDRLLQSERYGERWARHWLDVVRYAESGGYEFDGDRPGAHHYRDFVIKAFNQDMPYDEFIRLQIAGDHLKPGDFAAVSATGFLVAGPYPGQTTAKTLEPIRYDHLDDMVSTMGTSMLGLSLGCARCHAHKYDPIPQEDYYRLIAVLSRTDSAQAKLDPDPEIHRKAKAEFDRAHAPFVSAVDHLVKDQLPKKVSQWYDKAKSKTSPGWLVLDALDAKGKAPLKKLPDGSLRAGGKPEKGDTYTITAQTFQKGLKAVRLEALTDDSLPNKGPGRGADGNFLLTEISLTAVPANQPKAQPVVVKLKPVKATHQQEKFALAGTVDNNKATGWSVAPQFGKKHAALFEIEGMVGFDAGTLLTFTLKFEGEAFGMANPRLSIAANKSPDDLLSEGSLQAEEELRTLLSASKGEINDKNRADVVRWFRLLDAETEKVHAALEEHARKEPQPNLIPVFAATSGRGGDVHFLVRGETERKNGVMKPGFMQVLMNAPRRDQHWLAPATKETAVVEPRVALSKWITDPQQGAGNLLARVIVNRLWQHHFGRGLVATPNDFGVQGEPPTHPELLDYLASELIRASWRLKPIHKLIVTSAAYRQSGDVTEQGMKIDPLNQLWWRKPARRLEAEAIRDGLLSVGGNLNLTMFGPGTLDGNNPRRSVYLTVKRSQMIPLLQLFDIPEAIQSIGERSRTTVATQALAFMNSPFVRQQADKLAARVRPKSADVLAQIDEAYRIALSRSPTTLERDRMLAFIQRQMASYGASPKAGENAMIDCCQLLLCLNEFVYID
jgi:hypothetical protein